MSDHPQPPSSDPSQGGYAELHCISSFTFLRGASHPEELVARAHELGYRALALTDECSLAGVVRAHVAAKDRGLPLILGSEIGLADGPRLVLLAADREGYGNLSQLITARRGQGELSLDARRSGRRRAGVFGVMDPGGKRKDKR